MTNRFSHIKLSFVTAFILLFGACAEGDDKKVYQAALEQSLTEYPEAVGIMTHIEAPDQNLSWSGTAGFSDWEKTQALEVDQPALIASITKTYMATAILRLVEEGALKLDQSLVGLLSPRTDSLMRAYNFTLDSIQVKHLLAHKSGIPGYVPTEEFLGKLSNEPSYRWTRDEQIALAIRQGPSYSAGTRFQYTDTNYLLLGEILESLTGLTFYEAIRKLIDYKKLGLNHTWFYTLDSIPPQTKSLIHQYVPSNQEDSYVIDNSFDLYGGGGIATSTADLAHFISSLFQGRVFQQDSTLSLLFTDVPGREGDLHEDYINNLACEYYLGIQGCGEGEDEYYWHHGYWGTIYRYYPALNATIVIFVVNESQFDNINSELNPILLEHLSLQQK